MKFEHGAVVMTDSETGKPYARFLSPMELNLVLGQLQALDGGALNAREVAPFIMRTTGVSQGDAERIAEKRAGLHVVARNETQITPVDQALIDATRMTRQKFCPHETVLAGVCIACDKRVKP